MATPERDWERAIRPDGQRWWRNCLNKMESEEFRWPIRSEKENCDRRRRNRRAGRFDCESISCGWSASRGDVPASARNSTRCADDAGANLSGAQVDVTDESAAQKFVADVAAQNGSIDALIVAVGGYAGGKNLWEADSKTYEQMMNLNLKAAWTMARAVSPVMIRQNRGVADQHRIARGIWTFRRSCAVFRVESRGAGDVGFTRR